MILEINAFWGVPFVLDTFGINFLFDSRWYVQLSNMARLVWWNFRSYLCYHHHRCFWDRWFTLICFPKANHLGSYIFLSKVSGIKYQTLQKGLQDTWGTTVSINSIPLPIRLKRHLPKRNLREKHRIELGKNWVAVFCWETNGQWWCYKKEVYNSISICFCLQRRDWKRSFWSGIPFHSKKATLLQLGESLLFTRITKRSPVMNFTFRMVPPCKSGWYCELWRASSISGAELESKSWEYKGTPQSPPQEISLKKGLIRWFFGGLVIL